MGNKTIGGFHHQQLICMVNVGNHTWMLWVGKYTKNIAIKIIISIINKITEIKLIILVVVVVVFGAGGGDGGGGRGRRRIVIVIINNHIIHLSSIIHSPRKSSI